MENVENKWFEDHIDPDVAKAVIRLSVKLHNDSSIDRDFRPDVHIDYDNLEEQLEIQPSLYAFWSSVLSEQRASVAKIERIIKARRGIIARKLIAEQPDITKWKLEEVAESDKELNRLEGKLIQQKRTESKLFAIVDALKIKTEMLRSLAGFKRIELQDAR